MNFSKVMKGGMAAMMAMSLAACSSSSTTTEETTGSTTESSASESTGAAFKLGMSGPLTGDAAVYGQAVKNGAEIAIEEINAKGGVQFELLSEDDEADAEKAVNAYNALVDEGMQVSLGCVTSGAGQAVSQLYQDDNIFAITPSGSSTSIVYADGDSMTQPYGNIFQMCFTDPNQGTASADYFAEHTDLGSKIGVIYRSDDAYSTGIYNNFMKEAEAVGLDVVSEQSFVDGATDYSAQVKACVDAGADLIFLPIYYTPASQILIEADKQGADVNFFGCDGMDGILTLEGFDTALAEGLYMLTPFSADATDDLTVNFVTKYNEKTGETPTQFAADAYDCVYAIAQALEAAGLDGSASTDDITAALIEQFTSMTFNGVTGSDVTWSETGEVSKSPKAIVIQDGAYVGVE